jgi:hypothetical protein
MNGQGTELKGPKLLTQSGEGELVFQPIPERVIEAARGLVYHPSRYFVLPQNCSSIPLTALVRSRARPDGINRAIELMAAAYRGAHDRRVPIRVRPIADGRYLVVDGNSTVTVAAAAGWPDIPCLIEPPI